MNYYLIFKLLFYFYQHPSTRNCEHQSHFTELPVLLVHAAPIFKHTFHVMATSV